MNLICDTKDNRYSSSLLDGLVNRDKEGKFRPVNFIVFKKIAFP